MIRALSVIRARSWPPAQPLHRQRNPSAPLTSLIRLRRASRHGDILYILFTVVLVLFILVMSLGYVYRQQVTQISHLGPRLQAYYLATSGLDKTVGRIKELFDRPLVTMRDEARQETQVDAEVLGVLDPDRAKEWARRYEYKDGEVLGGGTVEVLAELLEVSRNPFSATIDRVEKIPPSLEPYRERRDEEDNAVAGAQPLGGWSGRLKLTATSSFQGHRAVVEMVKDVRVVDISPPAPDHTLFIHGKKTEFLKEGTFTLSNLTLPDQVLDLIHQLTLKINEVLRVPEVSEARTAVLANVEHINRKLVIAETDGEDATMLKLVQDIVQHVSAIGGDERIKDTVDNIILSLNPRDWGRVRTNGVLQIYLPFFSPDDIINFFADSSSFGQQRPEIGYSNCYNRLHDPYLSVYTHYEGYIYKNYRRLNPALGMGGGGELGMEGGGGAPGGGPGAAAGGASGKEEPPQVVPPQRYTINTRMNYVLRYPEREAVPNLDRLVKQAAKYASIRFKKPVVLVGTKDNPIQLEGIWHSQEEIRIQGPYTGRGTLVSDKGIIVTGDLEPAGKSESHLLALVALEGAVEVLRSGQTKIKAGIYAREGLRGSKNGGVKLHGNLAVENLNRDQMPRVFECRFNPHLKNHTADNLFGSISRRVLSFRILSDQHESKASRRTSL